MGGPETAPAYFREHPSRAVYLLFGMIPVAMCLPAYIAAKCWLSAEEEAKVKFYEKHAVLFWRDQEIYIRKGELRIQSPRCRPGWFVVYVLKIPGKRMVFVTSGKEANEVRKKKKLWLSLEIAVQRLSAYEKSEGVTLGES